MYPEFASTDHEQVVYCHDSRTGLRAIIAIYSTALGPSLGGTRFYPYASEAEALDDVLRLSRAMAYKAACAGLPLGGGKAVIIGDPERDKNEDLLRAYARFVQSLAGRYYTACDVGTFPKDMDVLARESHFVTGRTTANGGVGDSSVLTAYGVFEAMRAAVQAVWGEPALLGLSVGVMGAGKVGRKLVQHLLKDGASVVVADVSAAACAAVRDLYPEIQVVPPEDLLDTPMNVYAPCALGGALDEHTIARLDAQIVCGGANNQLADDGVADVLLKRKIVYVPDYVANAGGLIQVAGEINGYGSAQAKPKVAGIFDTTKRVLEAAAHDNVSPAKAADRLAEERLQQGGTRGPWLPCDAVPAHV